MGLFDERKTLNAINIPLSAAGALDATLLNAYGLVTGYVATAATGIIAVRGTTYTEPSSAQQMRVVSSSASDDGSPQGVGTGVVRLTYYDGSMAGPFTEDITLNGTTPVSTVATNIRFIEKLETTIVGSTGTNVGTISLQAIGGGTTFVTIAVSDGISFLAHHYVAVSKKCCVSRIYSGTQGASGSLFARVAFPLTTNAFEKQVTARLRTITAQPSQIFDIEPVMWIVGPARFSLWFQPDANTANTVQAGFAFYEL